MLLSSAVMDLFCVVTARVHVWLVINHISFSLLVIQEISFLPSPTFTVSHPFLAISLKIKHILISFHLIIQVKEVGVVFSNISLCI